VGLEELLEKNKWKEFNDKLQLPQDLAETDDLSVFVSFLEGGEGLTGTKLLCKNLFLFMCSLAGESISSNGMSATDQLQQYHTQFLFWMDNVDQKEEFRSGILRLFPDQKLPQQFHDHVRALNTNPTVKWIKDHGLQSKSIQVAKNMKLGALVKASFETCKREINGLANPLFISREKLPSGISEYAYFYFMRKQFWPARAEELASNAVKQAFARDPANKNMPQYKKKDHLHAIRKKAELYPFDGKWYPEWWLSFIFLGMPAGDMVRDGFKSGMATYTSSLQEIRDLSSKVNRRTIDEALVGRGEGA
jgi:hypothetical protein